MLQISILDIIVLLFTFFLLFIIRKVVACLLLSLLYLFCLCDRFRNHDSEPPPSLFYSQSDSSFEVTLHSSGQLLLGPSTSSRDGHVLNGKAAHGGRRVGGSGVLISSEPLNYESEQWHLVPANSMIVVTAGNLMT